MKCVNCGGEVDSQAISCPYCGTRNETGIAFYKEVCQKIQRNKLLAPLLLRQKTPELVQRMLTRIIAALGVLGIVLLGISFGLFMMIDDPIYSDRKPESDSYAWEYVGQQEHYYNHDYQRWTKYANEFMDAWDSGKMISRYHLKSMLDYGFEVYYDEDMSEELQQQAKLEIDAMLRGILQLSDEEMALFHQADERYTYSKQPDPEAQEQLVELLIARLENRLEEE